jgi:catechol 2,3-dioxygenase-like lactoylglutathione lyase family enzyme
MPDKQAPEKEAIAFEGVNPILRVDNLEASIDYYTRVLGFHVNWRTTFIASVKRGRCDLFLSQDDQGHAGAWVWIGVGDVETLFAEYIANGAKVRHSPTNYPWACEMQIEDLDGNVLRMGSDSKEGQPFGEWLDMYGDRWISSPTGEPVKLERV